MMPFYEYQCEACGVHHEAMQKMSDAPLRKCPACGKARLKRLISAPVFRLKGGGWYETDFKSDKEAKRNLHGAEAKESKEPGEAKGSEAKAETAGGFLIRRNPDANWCTVIFAEKPSREILDALKAAGYGWGGGCWNGYLDKLPAVVSDLEKTPLE